MRMAFWQRLAVLALFGMGVSSLGSTALAAQFEHQEIEQDRFIVLAAPGGEIGYKLLILEQLNNRRPCWNETGSNPSNVEPLLLTFDFTGICTRLVDSNGFSIRTAGVDHALQYSLRIIREDNDLVLVAASNTDREAQVEIGRTHGIPAGFSRIILDPGWRLTRRAYNGKAVGHIYITYDQPIELLVASARRQGGVGGQSPIPTPMPGQPDGTNVIPVPSLPLDSPTPALPPSEIPANPNPAPLPEPAPSSNPSLSTILPPPPPALTPSPTGSATPPAAGPSPQTSPDSPLPPATSAPSPTATDSTEPDQSATSPPATPSSVRPTQRPTSGASTTGSSTNNRTGSTASRTPAPSRVPAASNSGGTLLRPRGQRQTESTAQSRSTGSNAASSTSGSTAARTPNRNTTAPETASETAPETASETQPSSSSATPGPVAQASTYQVIVVADSAETQDKVRSLAPNAFLTTINGQVVMQVGVFRDRQEADQLQQRLSLEGLPTAVIPVR